jgi:hypothetical protein
MPNDPRSLAEVLKSGALARLSLEAEQRRATTAAVCRQLATAEAEHVVSASLDGAGNLVIVMDSPAWAARMRYRAATLPYERVFVKVQPRG